MSSSPGKRRPWFVLVLVCLAAGLPLAAAELMLRSRGVQPWQPLPSLHPSEPKMGEPDPELSWRNKPGRYVFPGYTPDVERITITIDERGRRSSGPSPDRPRARVALLGDSITMGWAISDDETFAWKLQERFPDLAFENYGTTGFGTYQSLLVMRHLLAADPPELVLYGFYSDHLQRNVQAYQWMNLHDRNRRELTAPYCTIDADGHLVEHVPEPLPQWPLRESLASVYFLEQRYVRESAERRAKDAWPVGKSLITAMDEAARRRGSRFALVFLMGRPGITKPMKEFLRAGGIRFVDCERALGPQSMVVNEGHPNGRVNTEWADCIAAALPDLLGAGAPAKR